MEKDTTLKYPLWQKVLAYLYDKEHKEEIHLSQIMLDLKVHYSYMRKLIKDLEDYGLVNLKKSGRKQIVYLTKRGMFYAKFSYGLLNLINKGE